MGMIMTYARIDGALLQELLCANPEEIFEKLQEVSTDKDAFLSLDKLWDGVHCLLTGQSAIHPPAENLLSEAVIGSDAFGPEEAGEIMTCIPPERLPKILAALQQVDLQKLQENFSPEAFAAMDIYPSIWLQEDREDLARELLISLQALIDFYKTAVEKAQGIILSIL